MIVAQLCLTLSCLTVVHQAPLSMEFSSKNTGVGCHFLLQCMKVKMEVKLLSRVRLFKTPWTTAHQALPSMGFSRQEYWSGMPLPSLISFLYPLLFTSLLLTAICKVSLDSHFAFLAFLFHGDGLDPCLLYNFMNLHP